MTVTTQPKHRVLHSIQKVATSPGRWGKTLLILATLGVGIALIAVVGKWIGAELPRFEEWIRELGWLGPAAFVATFVLLTLFQVPESLLAVAAGVAFGLWEGSIVVIVANFTAALCGFYVYRLIFRKRFEKMLENHPRTHAIESAVAEKGFSLMVLLRLGPFNFSMLNAIFGASEVRLAPFLFSLIGVIPGNFATVYFGTVARHVAQKSAGVDDLSTTHEISLLIGFVITVIVCLFVGHVAKHALEHVEAEQKAALSE